MSFSGFSFRQKGQLDGLTKRIVQFEEAHLEKAVASIYDDKIINLDEKDNTHFTKIAALDNGKVKLSNYTDKIATLISTDTTREQNLNGLTTQYLDKISKEEFDAKLELLDAIAENHDLRLDELEKRQAEVHTSLYQTAVEELAKKTDDDVAQAFNTSMESIDTGIGAQITQLLLEKNGLEQVQQNQGTVIIGLLDQSEYDTKKTELIARNKDIEKRLLAVDQFFRVMETTYKIYSPLDRDKQIIYTGDFQNTIPTPSILNVIHRRGTSKIGIYFTEFGYNTFHGSIRIEKNNGSLIGTLIKSEIPSAIEPVGEITFTSPVLSTDYPIRIKLLNSSNETLETDELPTHDDYLALPDLDFINTPLVLSSPSSSYKFLKSQAIAPIQISSNLDVSSYTMTPDNIGLTISNTGQITGMVDMADTYNITVSGSTSDGRTGSVQFSMVIDINRKFIPTWGKYLDGNNINSDDGTGGIAVDSDNNVYVVGHIGDESTTLYGSTTTKPATSSGDGVYLTKYNSSGTRQWVRWLDGAGSDRAYNICCGDGIIYIAGNGGFETTGNFPGISFPTIYGTKTSTTDGFIAAYSPTNAPLWMRWLAGSGSDNALSVYTRQNNSSIVYVCGSAGASTTTLGSDLDSMGAKPTGTENTGYLIKLKSTGEFDWGKWIDASGDDSCEDVIVDTSNNVYVIGYASGSNTSNSNAIFGQDTKPSTNMDSFIIKYSLSGTVQWALWMGEAVNDKYIDMCIHNNVIYLTGYTTRNGLRRTVVDKVGTNGTIIDYICIGENAPGEHYGNGITVDSDGFIYICGVSVSGNNIGSNSPCFPNSASVASKGFLIKLDNAIEIDNNMLVIGGTWLGNTGASNTGRFITIDSNNNLLVAGNATGSLTPFDTEIISVMGQKPDTSRGGFVIKFDQGLF